jgi:hypothetical protein
VDDADPDPDPELAGLEEAAALPEVPLEPQPAARAAMAAATKAKRRMVFSPRPAGGASRGRAARRNPC